MSEYQYYEFLTLDQPLTDEQMQEVRKLSTRARITATSFVNEYHWGDFRGDINRFMTKYYDVFVYFANWGSRELRFRLPKQDLDVDLVKRYCVRFGVGLHKADDCIVLSFSSEDESAGDWQSDGGWMPALAPLRADLLSGDYRCLYLGWLNGVGCREVGEDQPAPPVPPGLSELTAPLRALADFLRIDESLIKAAAEASDPLAVGDESDDALRSRVESLPLRDKEDFLVRMIQESPAVVRRELGRRLCGNERPRWLASASARTAGDLLEVAEQFVAEKRRLGAEKRAGERARRQKEAAAARQRHLDALAKRESQAWAEVEALIATRKSKAYDQAVELLCDLRDLAERQQRLPEALSRLDELNRRHGRKYALIRRLEAAGLDV